MCKKFQFDHTNKWYIHNLAPVLENNTHKLLWDFNIQTDHLIPVRRPDLIIINKKKRICTIVDFAVPADHRIKLKECEKKDKYLDLARKLKKLWNMKVTIVPIVIGALGTITKGLLKGLEDLEVGERVETIQTTALLRTARILRRVLETWGDLLSLKVQWKNYQLMLVWKTQKGVNNDNNDNSECRLCGDRDETINHIISEFSKLAQREYKARHDWVGKVIHWEMCKKFKFDHTNKWYMHNPAPVLENETHKLLRDFDIQTDHLIPARRPDLIIINKKKRTCKIVDFAVPTDHRIKLKECEKKDKYLDLKKLWNMQVKIISIVIGAFGTVTKGLLKGLGSWRTSRDHLNDSIIENS